jgi:hypothetical protein
MNDFYVGYLPKSPEQLGRRTKKAIIFLLSFAIGLALLLIFFQQPFAAATFEYGKYRNFSGIIEEKPYPMLRIARPGINAGESRYLLVAPGKHGAEALAKGMDSKQVQLRGSLIYRDGQTMVEVIPGTINISTATSSVASSTDKSSLKDLGLKTLTGEIVDTKCFLGVMNPGQGKVHRDCAARCISGGIPSGFVSNGELYYLIAPQGQPLNTELISKVSEPVTITGRITQRGDLLFLEMEATSIMCARKDLSR